jgi:hypothetical protein
MKFSTFRALSNAATGMDSVVQYLKGELGRVFNELNLGLSRLDLLENFVSFEVTVEIAANTEKEIPVLLPGNALAQRYLIVDANEGGLYVCRGDNIWAPGRAYLKNTSATEDAKIKVIFFK